MFGAVTLGGCSALLDADCCAPEYTAADFSRVRGADLPPYWVRVAPAPATYAERRVSATRAARGGADTSEVATERHAATGAAPAAGTGRPAPGTDAAAVPAETMTLAETETADPGIAAPGLVEAGRPQRAADGLSAQQATAHETTLGAGAAPGADQAPSLTGGGPMVLPRAAGPRLSAQRAAALSRREHALTPGDSSPAETLVADALAAGGDGSLDTGAPAMTGDRAAAAHQAALPGLPQAGDGLTVAATDTSAAGLDPQRPQIIEMTPGEMVVAQLTVDTAPLGAAAASSSGAMAIDSAAPAAAGDPEFEAEVAAPGPAMAPAASSAKPSVVRMGNTWGEADLENSLEGHATDSSAPPASDLSLPQRRPSAKEAGGAVTARLDPGNTKATARPPKAPKVLDVAAARSGDFDSVWPPIHKPHTDSDADFDLRGRAVQLAPRFRSAGRREYCDINLEQRGDGTFTVARAGEARGPAPLVSGSAVEMLLDPQGTRRFPLVTSLQRIGTHSFAVHIQDQQTANGAAADRTLPTVNCYYEFAVSELGCSVRQARKLTNFGVGQHVPEKTEGVCTVVDRGRMAVPPQ